METESLEALWSESTARSTRGSRRSPPDVHPGTGGRWNARSARCADTSTLRRSSLSPHLREAEPGLAAPVAVMLRGHAQIWSALDSLERERDVGVGAGTALCRPLTVQLLHHNLKEERILYPRADDALPAAAVGRLRAFLDSGTCPGGWVCIKARG